MVLLNVDSGRYADTSTAWPHGGGRQVSFSLFVCIVPSRRWQGRKKVGRGQPPPPPKSINQSIMYF